MNAKFLIKIKGQQPIPFECSVLNWYNVLRQAALTILRYSDNPKARCEVVSVPLGVLTMTFND